MHYTFYNTQNALQKYLQKNQVKSHGMRRLTEIKSFQKRKYNLCYIQNFNSPYFVLRTSLDVLDNHRPIEEETDRGEGKACRCWLGGRD